jgi:hypothetical protein
VQGNWPAPLLPKDARPHPLDVLARSVPIVLRHRPLRKAKGKRRLLLPKLRAVKLPIKGLRRKQAP